MAINQYPWDPPAQMIEGRDPFARRRRPVYERPERNSTAALWGTGGPASRSYGAGGGAGGGTDWDQLVQEIYGGIGGQDPYLAQLEGLTQKWLDPNYQAYSDEQIQDWYNQGKGQLEGDIFRDWDEGYGRTMANRNITGSGAGNIDYGKILGRKGGALGELWSVGQERADQATRADVSRGTALIPVMTQMRNIPQEQRMQLLSLLTAVKTGQMSADAARQSANASGLGAIFGAIITAITGIPA